jgi:hypothetical protein
MSIQVLDQTIGNGSSLAVILGGGGSPYTTAGAAVPPTDVGFTFTTNFTTNTGFSLNVYVSQDYQLYLAGQIAAPNWAPVGVYNNTALTNIAAGTAITGIDSAITAFTVPYSGASAIKIQQTGAIGGAGTPTINLKSVSSLPITQVLPPVSISVAAVTDNSGGTASSTAGVVATAYEDVKIIPAQLADFVNAGTWTLALPFNFTVLSALWRTGKPASTASKLTTLTLSTSTGAVTGGVMALTTANQNATGGTVAATAISGANATVVAGGTIILTPSSTTAFVEGDGWCEITIKNNDSANAAATIIALANSMRAALIAA